MTFRLFSAAAHRDGRRRSPCDQPLSREASSDAGLVVDDFEFFEKRAVLLAACSYATGHFRFSRKALGFRDCRTVFW